MTISEILFWAGISYYAISAIKEVANNSLKYQDDRLALLSASIELHEGNSDAAVRIIDGRLEEGKDEYED